MRRSLWRPLRQPRVNPITIARDRIPITVGCPIRLRRRLVKSDDLTGSGRLPSSSHGRAETQALLVDFCNPNTPRAPPRDRPIPAESRLSPRARPRVTAASPLRNSSEILRPRARHGESAATANRGFTGQGPPAFAGWGRGPIRQRHRGTSCASARRQATCRSFAPTRSARTPPVAGTPLGWKETPALRAILPRAASPGLPRRRPRSTAPEVPSIDDAGSPVAAPPKRHHPWPRVRPGRTDSHRGSELSTACHQDVEKTGAFTAFQRFLRSRTFRCP